ncbi:MAG: hypothetical protein AAFZ58_16475 [Pseudomonadota bacterium]
MPEGWTIPGALLLAGFLLGVLVVMLTRSRRIAALEQRSLDLGKNVNALKAEKNVVDKKLTTAGERIEELETALSEREQRVEELETAYSARSDQLEQTRTDLKAAVQQTQDLRKDLVQHAEDTIKAEAHARDVENELSMLTGSGDSLDTELRDELDSSEDDDAPALKDSIR